MRPSAAVAIHSKSEHCHESERDLMLEKARGLVLMGASQFVAIAHDDFRRELRKELEEHGTINLEFFEGASGMLDEEIEKYNGAAENFLTEEQRTVLP